jgi:hypothetical protein
VRSQTNADAGPTIPGVLDYQGVIQINPNILGLRKMWKNENTKGTQSQR